MKRISIFGVFRSLCIVGMIAPYIHLTGKEPTLVKRGAPHIIQLSMYQNPVIPIEDFEHRTIKKLSEPEKILRAIIKNHLRAVGGVPVTYFGIGGLLQPDAEATFPRKHADDTATIIIVKRIYPIIKKGETVERFIRKKSEPAAYYSIKRSKDPITENSYWEAKKIETPKNLSIPVEAIVICAKPDEIYIPEIITSAIAGPNLILPTIYPTTLFKRGAPVNTMSFLKISKYFEPVRKAYRYAKTQDGKNVDRIAVMLEA